MFLCFYWPGLSQRVPIRRATLKSEGFGARLQDLRRVDIHIYAHPKANFDQKVGYVGKFWTLASKKSAQKNVRPRLPGHIGRPPGGLPNGTTPVSRAPRVADFSSKFGPKFARPWSSATNPNGDVYCYNIFIVFSND